MKDLVAERIPWVVYEAADWLRETVKPDWDIFEWGSGGSTTFFLSLGADVVSVEHDPKWFAKVKAATSTCDKWSGHCLPPKIGGGGALAPSMRHPGCFNDYVQAFLRTQPWDAVWDLVFVDGRARNHCAKLAAPRIKPGGWLVLDNSDRADYKPTFDLLRDWAMVEFHGHGPLSDILWKTTMWRKPGGTP